MFDKADAWRRPERFAQLLDACRADFHYRTGFEERVYAEPDYVAQALAAAQAVPVKEIVAVGSRGGYSRAAGQAAARRHQPGARRVDLPRGLTRCGDEAWIKARVTDPGFLLRRLHGRRLFTWAEAPLYGVVVVSLIVEIDPLDVGFSSRNSRRVWR